MQGASRLQTGSAHTAAVLSARTLPDDTDQGPAVHFDEDFDRGFQFELRKLRRRLTTQSLWRRFGMNH